MDRINRIPRINRIHNPASGKARRIENEPQPRLGVTLWVAGQPIANEPPGVDGIL
jgi:hypothetical protein